MSSKNNQNNAEQDEKEALTLAVKLFLNHLRNGKLHLAPHLVTRLEHELKQVQFNEAGDPLFESIPPMVKSLAKATLQMEPERRHAEELEREKQSPVHSLLKPAVDLSDEVLGRMTKDAQFTELAFELYKETVMVLFVTVSIQATYQKKANFVFPKNQAICAALLARIIKFMRAVLAMLSHGDEIGEVILALSRCIAESVINLRYLILKDDEALYTQFIKLSLSPERELYDVIQKNIEGRSGHTLPVETRMLASIDRLCRLAGVSIVEVNSKYKEWGGGLRQRIKALGLDAFYAGLQRIPSHAIHGTWVDLMLHHMEDKEEGYALELNGAPVDTRLLGPLCIFILTGANDYINRYLVESPEVRPLSVRVEDLQGRIHKLDAAHEEWYQQNKKLV